MEQYDFATEQWIAALRRIVETGLARADLEGVHYAFSQEFTNPPRSIGRRKRRHKNEQNRLGYHIVVNDGKATVGEGPLDEADAGIVSDYELSRQLARTVFSPDESAVLDLRHTIDKAIHEGRFSRFGDFASTPRAIEALDLHNEMARRTK